jgi:hypothetical protein
MSKPPTPQGISRLLAKAGFERMTYRKSRVRGMNEHTAGFEVQQNRPDVPSADDGAMVTWWATSFAHDRRVRELDKMLAEYAAVIERAGYAVKQDGTGWLIVTAGEDTP